ncbi:hypothetical protein ACF08W_28785 [Streptomyces sp. NPDC015144]|uniref:hypothetical protein n=1 Tax=Streptomyces sp. NPDC015144 TaxID=3364944 RepID=UPI0036FD0685
MTITTRRVAVLSPIVRLLDAPLEADGLPLEIMVADWDGRGAHKLDVVRVPEPGVQYLELDAAAAAAIDVPPLTDRWDSAAITAPPCPECGQSEGSAEFWMHRTRPIMELTCHRFLLPAQSGPGGEA